MDPNRSKEIKERKPIPAKRKSLQARENEYGSASSENESKPEEQSSLQSCHAAVAKPFRTCNKINSECVESSDFDKSQVHSVCKKDDELKNTSYPPQRYTWHSPDVSTSIDSSLPSQEHLQDVSNSASVDRNEDVETKPAPDSTDLMHGEACLSLSAFLTSLEPFPIFDQEEMFHSMDSYVESEPEQESLDVEFDDSDILNTSYQPEDGDYDDEVDQENEEDEEDEDDDKWYIALCGTGDHANRAFKSEENGSVKQKTDLEEKPEYQWESTASGADQDTEFVPPQGSTTDCIYALEFQPVALLDHRCDVTSVDDVETAMETPWCLKETCGPDCYFPRPVKKSVSDGIKKEALKPNANPVSVEEESIRKDAGVFDTEPQNEKSSNVKLIEGEFLESTEDKLQIPMDPPSPLQLLPNKYVCDSVLPRKEWEMLLPGTTRREQCLEERARRQPVFVFERFEMLEIDLLMLEIDLLMIHFHLSHVILKGLAQWVLEWEPWHWLVMTDQLWWKILLPVQRLIAENCQPDVVRLHRFERGHRSRFINQDRKRRVAGYESEPPARQDVGWFPRGCSQIITSPASVPLLPNANLDCEGDKLVNPSLEQPDVFQIVESQDAPLLFTLAVELTACAVNAMGLWVSMVSTASLLASTEWVKVAARQQPEDENENQAVVSAGGNNEQEISAISRCGLDWIFSPQSHGITSAFGGYQQLECYVLARFPENQNPLVSLSLQRKLDEKSPREYLTAVLHDLSLEERDSLMVDEKQRRKTFLVNWPHDGNLSGEKMAQAGFYCVDDYDRVQCVFCRGSLHRWDPEDIPMTEHARSFPFCRFIKGLDCGNREYKNDVLPVDDLKNITYLCHPDMKKNRDGTISTNSSAFGISTNKAQMIRYAPYETRKATFAKWPTANKIGPEKLIEAGFYYIGFDDTVRCFYCAGSLREWAKDDDPWMEHARWFPDCSYLVQLKGEAYIEHIHAITPEGKKCSRQTELEKKTEKEYKQRVSVQQAMEEFCLKMGHEKEVVDEVMLLNDGVPYDKPRDMIEMLYKVEERLLPASDRMDSGYETLSINLKDRPQQMVMANEDLRKLLAGEDQVDKDFTMVDAMPDVKVPAATCHTCYRKTGQPISAIYIGLPCGHLIYCESCKADERKKCDNSASYKSKCASRGCSATLSGLFRSYIN